MFLANFYLATPESHKPDHVISIWLNFETDSAAHRLKSDLRVYGNETYSKLAQLLLKIRIYALLGSETEMFFLYFAFGTVISFPSQGIQI